MRGHWWVLRVRIELTTPRSSGECSNRLSYLSILSAYHNRIAQNLSISGVKQRFHYLFHDGTRFYRVGNLIHTTVYFLLCLMECIPRLIVGGIPVVPQNTDDCPDKSRTNNGGTAHRAQHPGVSKVWPRVFQRSAFAYPLPSFAYIQDTVLTKNPV